MDKLASLYIHIPFCISKCKYCDFFSVVCKNRTITDEYIDALCNELVYRLKNNKIDSLKTIYIGGGTPSLLTFSQLKKFFSTINCSVRVESSAEITIEVNPDDVTLDKLNEYSSVGINRISCGIQSMNDTCLNYSSRRANVEINRKAMNILKDWKGKLSLDLICGLPYETEQSFIKGLEEIVKINPEHISMYTLTVEKNTPFGKACADGSLEIDDEFVDELWIKSKEFLEENGFIQYEVSNFAKKNCECKHNLVYWNHEGYLGCGCGATGTVYLSDGSAQRWSNIPDIDLYISFWLQKNTDFEKIPQNFEFINTEDSIFEFFMMGLRKLTGVNEASFKRTFNKEIPDNIIRVFYRWKEKNMCDITETSSERNFSLGKKGILYLNKFLEEIL